jgi:streptogramin lyase
MMGVSRSRGGRRVSHARALLVAVGSLGGCGEEGRTVILIADAGNARIVQMDDFGGAGWATFAYPRVNTSFITPTAIAVDSRGRIYATNLADDNVSRMDDITGKGFVTLGTAGRGVGQFDGPFGIALDPQDRIYVADTNNGRLVRVDSIDGSGWTTLGSPGIGRNEFDEPEDVAIDSRDRIYVTDRGNRRIVRFDDMSGSGWTTYGRAGLQKLGPGVFDLLGGIAVATDGRIYVTDSNENVVIGIDDMAGAGYSYFGYVGNDSLFKQPTGIWVDGASPIYVASQNNSRVARFEDMGGAGYRSFGGPASGQARLDQPLDVVVARIPR